MRHQNLSSNYNGLNYFIVEIFYITKKPFYCLVFLTLVTEDFLALLAQTIKKEYYRLKIFNLDKKGILRLKINKLKIKKADKCNSEES